MTPSQLQLPIVSSLVIQVKPDNRKSVEAYIDTVPNAEIHGSDEHTKLVVVVEMADDARLSDFMNRVGTLEGVITVNMVFHHTDSGSVSAEKPIEIKQNA